MTKIAKVDYKYVPKDPELGFSPKRNKAIVDKTIKKYEAMRAKKERVFQNQFGERADAVATYFKSRISEGNTPPEKYFGRKMYAYLRGENIRDELLADLVVADSLGRVVKRRGQEMPKKKND